MLTALILLAIIAVWAAIFLFGLRQVFASDPPTKTAPTSFFDDNVALQASTGQAQDPNAPAGALPKDGSLPSGLGGTIAGTVTATSDHGPVGRILVEAIRPRADGGLDTASSAATQADGSFQVAGLFPGGYLLRFSADGFDPVFYPGTPDQAAATPVTAESAQVTAGTNVQITGHPASISGSVDPGDTLQPVVTTVTARQVTGPQAGQDVATTTTDGANAYTLPNLPAPATYQLSFAAEGYQPTVISTTVDGGGQRMQPTVLLTAGPGQIAGLVTGTARRWAGPRSAPPSAAPRSVRARPRSATWAGSSWATCRPRRPTCCRSAPPGTVRPPQVVDLGPGQNRTDLTFGLAAGTDQVSGRLVDTAGNGIGGATVTVGGMTNPPDDQHPDGRERRRLRPRRAAGRRLTDPDLRQGGLRDDHRADPGRQRRPGDRHDDRLAGPDRPAW